MSFLKAILFFLSGKSLNIISSILYFRIVSNIGQTTKDVQKLSFASDSGNAVAKKNCAFAWVRPASAIILNFSSN